MKNHKFTNKEVECVFDKYPTKISKKLLQLRESIYQVSQEHDQIGNIEETLKWDNPSYLTSSPKSGTTIRLSNTRSDKRKYAISVHCQSTLIAEFKEVYPELNYDGNRSIIFDANEKIKKDVVEHFIYLALTYHYRKKRGIGI